MFRFGAILKTLVEHNVDFILVGGLAGVLQGAPINNKDVDILYSLTPPNPIRLQGALSELCAKFRGDARNLTPDLSHLYSTGHKLLTTLFGDLDCLGTIEETTTYEDILPDCDEMMIDDTTILVISLPRLIEVKKKLSRPKDRVALVQLEATLDERSKAVVAVTPPAILN
jgi:predicted nucleotidyltransferase